MLIKWLCSSLQSLSSTVSSIESLGAPSTLKLPLWDKASAEFCFAKSRELLTKPSAWSSYMEVEFDDRILDNNSTKQNLLKPAEYLENGNRKSIAARESILGLETKGAKQNGKLTFDIDTSKIDFFRKAKRVSTSYIDRYFEQPKYMDEDDPVESPIEKVLSRQDNCVEINNLEHGSLFFSNFPEFSNFHSASIKSKINKSCQKRSDSAKSDLEEELKNFKSKDNADNFESLKNRLIKYDLSKDKLTNFDFGTRPKILDSTKLNTELEKLDLQKARLGKVSFIPRTQEMKADNVLRSTISGSSRGNFEAVRINIQNFHKIEQNQNGHDTFSFVMSNNPLFASEPEKKDSPIYSSSESLRVNFQRLRRKSDAEANSQVELSSQFFTGKYQREVSDLESVQNYLDSKKGQVQKLGIGKLTQNVIQSGEIIEQNSRSLDTSLLKPMRRNLDIPTQAQTPLKNFNKSVQKPKYEDLNIPIQGKQTRLKLNLKQNPASSPALHQHILEPPKLYQNDIKKWAKSDLFTDEGQGNLNGLRPRTSSLSEHKKSPFRTVRRSFNPKNNSSDDSDSISHSETDIRNRSRYKHRHKRIPHNFKLNFKNQSQFLHPNAARGFSSIELCSKSPPPSTSFLNSLSPPFSSRNNLLSWPESAPSSSLTFTSNSDLDSDTSTEYPEFTNDILSFPPSPAP